MHANNVVGEGVTHIYGGNDASHVVVGFGGFFLGWFGLFSCNMLNWNCCDILCLLRSKANCLGFSSVTTFCFMPRYYCAIKRQVMQQLSH